MIRIPEGHPEPDEAKRRFETALKGLVSVIQGLGEIRNLEGELGHGKDADRVALTPCHAEFAARAADVVVKFLVESHRSAQVVDGAAPRITYLANPDFNDYVDDVHVAVEIFAAKFRASEVLFLMDPRLYRDSLDEFRTEKEAEGAE